MQKMSREALNYFIIFTQIRKKLKKINMMRVFEKREEAFLNNPYFNFVLKRYKIKDTLFGRKTIKKISLLKERWLEKWFQCKDK